MKAQIKNTKTTTLFFWLKTGLLEEVKIDFCNIKIHKGRMRLSLDGNS